MKDSVALLFAALIVSGISWFYWHIASRHATDILMASLLVILLLDNLSLRRKIRDEKRK
jgi:hypothetical protein